MLKSSIDINIKSISHNVDKWRTSTIPNLPKGVPPHISLLYPWVLGEINIEQVSKLNNIIRKFSCFEITFESIEIFESGHIYLNIQTNKYLDQLHEYILNEFKEYKPYNGAFEKPHLHLTVGYEENGSNNSPIYIKIKNDLKEILHKAIQVDSISIMKEVLPNIWECYKNNKLVG